MIIPYADTNLLFFPVSIALSFSLFIILFHLTFLLFLSLMLYLYVNFIFYVVFQAPQLRYIKYVFSGNVYTEIHFICSLAKKFKTKILISLVVQVLYSKEKKLILIPFSYAVESTCPKSIYLRLVVRIGLGYRGYQCAQTLKQGRRIVMFRRTQYFRKESIVK